MKTFRQMWGYPHPSLQRVLPGPDCGLVSLSHAVPSNKGMRHRGMPETLKSHNLSSNPDSVVQLSDLEQALWPFRVFVSTLVKQE